MHAHEQLIRDFYAARDRRDWAMVGELLDPNVRWRESGEEDYSGEHCGRDTVIGLLQKFVEVTEGTFVLRPERFIVTAEHVAAHVRWSAERRGQRVEGNDLAVFRIADGRIARAWFIADGFDPEALTKIFTFQG